jgi:hypothetical protein
MPHKAKKIKSCVIFPRFEESIHLIGKQSRSAPFLLIL